MYLIKWLVSIYWLSCLLWFEVMFVFLHKSITDYLPVAGTSRSECSLCVREKQGFESQEPASNNLKFIRFIYDNMLATQGLVLIFFPHDSNTLKGFKDYPDNWQMMYFLAAKKTNSRQSSCLCAFCKVFGSSDHNQLTYNCSTITKEEVKTLSVRGCTSVESTGGSLFSSLW